MTRTAQLYLRSIKGTLNGGRCMLNRHVEEGVHTCAITRSVIFTSPLLRFRAVFLNLLRGIEPNIHQTLSEK